METIKLSIIDCWKHKTRMGYIPEENLEPYFRRGDHNAPRLGKGLAVGIDEFSSRFVTHTLNKTGEKTVLKMDTFFGKKGTTPKTPIPEDLINAFNLTNEMLFNTTFSYELGDKIEWVALQTKDIDGMIKEVVVPEAIPVILDEYGIDSDDENDDEDEDDDENYFDDDED